MACSLRWMLQGMFLLVALVTVSFSLYLFNVTSLGGTMDDSITSMAFFSKETLHTQEVGIAANATMAIEIPLASDGVIADFSISGELAGRGSVKVYLKGDDARYLVLDSGDLVHNKTLFQQEAGELENESEQENETVLAQAEEDGQLKTKLGYGNDSLYDPDNDGLETYAGAIDFTVRNSTLPEGINASNLCTLYTIENTLQDDSTVVCHGSEMCCLLSGLHPIREAWDEPFYLTYQQYGAGEKNDITARIVYAYYQLDAVNQEAEFRVGEDATLTGSFFKDRVSFFDSCVATCQNIAINSSIIELEIEVQDSSISIEKIHYTTRKEVEIKELYFTEIPDLSIGQGTAKTINLSDYLLEKRGNVTFSFYEVEGIGISLEGEIATIRPLLNEQAEYFTFFRATDGNERATSNVVAITTEGLATTEALAGAGSLRSRAKAIIGEAVSHTAQLSANQSEISLPQAAQSISVAAIIGDEKIPVEKEEVTIHHKGSATSLADYASSAGSQQGQGQARARGRAGSAAAVEEADDSSEENITLQIADASEGHEVSYQTQAPIARERNISESKKEIIISAPDELGYEDVLAFTHLPIEVPESSVKLYLLVNGTRTEVAVDMFDTNNNSLIDYIEWLVPHLSEQAYELELAISEAAETTGAIASRRIGTAGANTWTFQEILGSEDMEIELVHIDDDDEHYIFAASIIEKQELPEDFTFDIAICDNIGEVDFKDNAGLKGKGKIKEKISASQSKKAIKKKARHNWCSETSNNAYMLEENAGKAEINNDYLIYIPKNESNFTIYAGSGTQVIIATVDTSAKGDSWNRKIVRDSAGTLHMVYSDANDDPIYVNSTDGGLTWSTPQVIGAASAGTVNLLIDSNDKMYALWNAGGFRLEWATKPAGSPWSSLSIMPGFEGDLQDRFNSVDADISSTDTIHIAVTTTEFHDVTTHDFILYSNYTPEQGWYGDGTVVGFGDVVYNGTWILNDTAALAGGGFGTDIIVDSSDNVWVSTRQNTLGDTIVWKKAENGSWPNYQTLRTDNSGIGAMSASLNRDIVYAGYVAASTQLGFSNFTSASWDTNPATMVVDTLRTDSVSMLASSCPDESLYILYEDDESAGSMKVRLANSTDNGTTWTTSSLVTGLSANSIPSLRGSAWPAFNRLNGTIHYIYYNSSNQGLYFDTIDVPCPAVGGGDAISPSWRYNSTNVTATTTTNDMAEFGINWSDDVRLNYTIFSFDPGTGTWANDTPIGIENSSVVRNESKAITATVGQTIRWMWFANDTSGNMNQTDEWSFIAASSSTAPNVWNCSAFNRFDTASCWSLGRIPASDDDIIFNGSGTGNVNITNNTMPQSVTSFTVEASYTGTIHFMPLFANGTWTDGSESYSGTQEWNVSSNINISGGTMKVYGDYPYNLTGEGHGQEWRSLTGNVSIGSGAILDGIGLGFPLGVGPAVDSDTDYGGTHAGRGADNANGKIYGNATAPTSLGDAGGEAPGGSAIKLRAADTLRIDGAVTMSGAGSDDSLEDEGGAGGSIWLVGNAITGSGNLSANGATTDFLSGGGGRIRLEYGSSMNYTGVLTTTSGKNGYYGYIPGDPNGASDGVVTFTNNTYPGDWVLNGSIGLLGGNYGEGEVLQVRGDFDTHDFNISIYSDCFFDATNPLTCYNTTFDGRGVWINASGNITVSSGSTLFGMGFGFPPDVGPGADTDTSYGGTHGGKGASNAIGILYGNKTSPVSIGSGGDENSGGSAIRLQTGGTILIDGIIDMRGQDEISVDNLDEGGAGGSIWLIASNISGNGVANASGGSTDNAGGGGGRVALTSSGTIDFRGIISNTGGLGGGYGDGSGGTVFINASTSISSAMNITTNGYDGGNISIYDSLLTLSGIFNATGTNSDATLSITYTSCSSDFSGAAFDPSASYNSPNCLSVSLEQPANGTWQSSGSATFSYVATSPTLKNCSLWGDFSGAFAANETNTSITSGVEDSKSISLGNGAYLWNVLCYDTSGNSAWNATNYTVNIDSIQPDITLHTPSDALQSASSSIFFNYTATDNLDVSLLCNLTISGIVNQSGIASPNATNASFTISGFNDGDYAWNVTCMDNASNQNTSLTREFTVTTVAPIVENLSVTPAYPLNSSGVNVSANITSTGTISVAKILLHYPNGTNYVNYSLVSGGGDVYYNDSIIAGITPAGTYNVSIWVNDTAGNINNTVNGWFAPILNLTYEASITIDGLLDDWAGVSNYSDLVGDSNEPGGASTAVSSYDFSGIMYPSSTHNATYGYTALFPPEATVNVTSETEFNQTAASNGNNYTNIIADDGAYASYQTASSGAYAIHKFVFEIDESEGEVIEINISVIGTAGESAPIAEVYTNEWYFYIYNLSMSNWSLLWHETSGDTSQFVQKYMNASVLASTGDYIDNSKIYFISTTSIDGSPPVIGYSHVETDYANLSITYNAPEGDDFDIRRVALSNNGTSLFAFIDVNGSINYSDSTEYYRLFIDKNSSTGNTTTPESGSGIAVSYDFRVQVNASLCYVFNYTEEFTNISGCRIENGSNAIELDISMEDINVSGGDSINITFETGSASQSYDFAPDYRSFLSYTFSNITSGETEPNVTLNAPIHLFNTSLSAVNFNWTVVDLDTGNLSCNLTIDDVINASDIIAENSTATNYTVTGFIGGSHNWSVACNDSSATNTSAVWSFFIVTGPTASNITIAANTSIITIAWPAVSGADSYNIFITDSWSGGFSSVPNASGITDLNWSDSEANASATRYYRVGVNRGNVNSTGNVTLGKIRHALDADFNLIAPQVNVTIWELNNGSNGGLDLQINLADCISTIYRYNYTLSMWGALVYETDDDIWLPATGSDNFTSLQPVEGYFFENAAACNVTYVGIVPVNNVSYSLSADYSLIGWYSQQQTTIGQDSVYGQHFVTTPSEAITALIRYNTVTDTYETNRHYTGWGWWPPAAYADFTTLDPGRAYWADTSAAATWVHEP